MPKPGYFQMMRMNKPKLCFGTCGVLWKTPGTPENIAHVKVYLKDEKYRDNVNQAWTKKFPDENDPGAPALRADLRGKVLFQIEVIAVL